MKKIFFSICCLFLLPLFAQAQETGVEISPRIIDEKVLAGDLLKYDITIKNLSSVKQNMYAVVNDISEDTGEVKYINPNDLDRDLSITRWVEFKRGVIELMPGEEMIVPLKIEVSSTAKPGKKYARIALPNGSNRPIAEEGMASKSYAQLLINISIEENIVEKAQVKGFSTQKNIYLKSPVVFNVNLSNFGNRPIVPKGSIYIYNRRGEQIDIIDANQNQDTISPGDTWDKSIDWSQIKGMGKYKARLELEYGQVDKRDLQDTVFFWVLPWQFLLAFFIVFFLFLVLMVSFLFRKSYTHHHPQTRSSAISVHHRQEDSNKDGVLNLRD